MPSFRSRLRVEEIEGRLVPSTVAPDPLPAESVSSSTLASPTAYFDTSRMDHTNDGVVDAITQLTMRIELDDGRVVEVVINIPPGTTLAALANMIADQVNRELGQYGIKATPSNGTLVTVQGPIYSFQLNTTGAQELYGQDHPYLQPPAVGQENGVKIIKGVVVLPPPPPM